MVDQALEVDGRRCPTGVVLAVQDLDPRRWSDITGFEILQIACHIQALD